MLGAWASFQGATSALPRVSSAQARTGTYSLYFPDNSLTSAASKARAVRVLGAASNSVGVGFGVFLAGLPTAAKRIGWKFRNPSNGVVVSFYFEVDGSISIYNSADTLILSTTPILLANAWEHIECAIVFDNLVGYIGVRVNGILRVNEDNLDLGSVGVSSVEWGDLKDVNTGASSELCPFYIDDIFAWDNTAGFNDTYIGPVRISTLFPASDGVAEDWTVTGAASGHEAIDDAAPDDDTTYISSAVVDQVSEFGFAAIPEEIEAITTVYAIPRAKLAAVGSGEMRVNMRSGSDVANGDAKVITSSYAYRGTSFPTDPATDEPWTRESLEAAFVQVEKTA